MLKRFTKYVVRAISDLTAFIINYDHIFQYFPELVSTVNTYLLALGIILTTILTLNISKICFKMMMANLPLNWYIDIGCL